jgi:hypothetical protein
MNEVRNERNELTDPPGSEPRFGKCKCGHPASLSYYGCDADPYPFKGRLLECGLCGNIWEVPSPKINYPNGKDHTS